MNALKKAANSPSASLSKTWAVPLESVVQNQVATPINSPFANLTTAPGTKISTPVIAGCGLHYECKVVYKQMVADLLAPDLQEKWYGTGNYHTLFFGEILATYLDEE